jgi:hypothetical protein
VFTHTKHPYKKSPQIQVGKIAKPTHNSKQDHYPFAGSSPAAALLGSWPTVTLLSRLNLDSLGGQCRGKH